MSTIVAVVVQRQVAPQLRTGFTEGFHNLSDVAEATAVTLSWKTE